MAVIAPFRGVRYNQKKTGDLDGVVAPPYDVISPDDEQWLLGHHPNNIVRLILPKDNGGDKYERAGGILRGWLESGVLTQDDSPSFYVCEQDYEINGEWKRRLGLTCLVKLQDYGKGVLPHEKILSSPLEDRIKLMTAAKSNLDSVFGLYPGGETEEVLFSSVARDPDAVATDRNGVKCSLWRISDPAAIKKVVDGMVSENILIADGHHRYAAALAYRDKMREAAKKPDPEAPYEYIMMTLVSLHNRGLVVLPTHRMVRGLENFDADAFLAELSKLFDTAAVPRAQLAERLKSAEKKGTFGLYLGEDKSYLISLKAGEKPESLIKSAGSDALKKLDVSVLHSLILEGILGIGAKQLAGQSHLKYSQSPETVMNSVDSGESQAAVLLNATPVDDVMAVASTGDRMPQKSTYFYPKLLTGMVIRVIS